MADTKDRELEEFSAWAKSVEWWDFDPSTGNAISRKPTRVMAYSAWQAARAAPAGVQEPDGYRYSLWVEEQEVGVQYIEGEELVEVFGVPGEEHGGEEMVEPFWLQSANPAPDAAAIRAAALEEAAKVAENEPRVWSPAPDPQTRIATKIRALAKKGTT